MFTERLAKAVREVWVASLSIYIALLFISISALITSLVDDTLATKQMVIFILETTTNAGNYAAGLSIAVALGHLLF